MSHSVLSFRVKILIIVVHFCIAFSVFLLLLYTFLTYNSKLNPEGITKDMILTKLPSMKFLINHKEPSTKCNVWLIFTKVGIDSPLKYKFRNLVTNLVNTSTVPLNFHIIVDDVSQKIATMEFNPVVTNVTIQDQEILYYFYDVNEVANKIHDIVEVMTPHFSSKPGTYYSDALFYISLGLHRIAPQDQNLAVILDCDLYFKEDVGLLFKEFAKFKSSALFGLAPELSPVYRHVLHTFRTKHNNTSFGDFYHAKNVSMHRHPRGFQGYNSGLVLLNFNKIRQSKVYSQLLSKKSVESLVEKYHFRGHLGDQDFYTLLGFEYPDLIQTLNCGFNRQLCTWWRDHGYTDVFDEYFKCDHKIVVLHGNCNTRIPK